MSTQSLKLLTGESSQPRQFVTQFSACSAQHIPQLSGMVDILAGVSQDEDLKVTLRDRSNSQMSTKSQANMNSPDYKKLRERLLKEAVNSTEAKLVVNKPKSKKIDISFP